MININFRVRIWNRISTEHNGKFAETSYMYKEGTKKGGVVNSFLHMIMKVI